MAEQPFKQKQTRRARFLSEMEAAVPWSRLVALLEPFYPEGARGRPPWGIERMLRGYCLPSCPSPIYSRWREKWLRRQTRLRCSVWWDSHNPATIIWRGSSDWFAEQHFSPTVTGETRPGVRISSAPWMKPCRAWKRFLPLPRQPPGSSAAAPVQRLCKGVATYFQLRSRRYLRSGLVWMRRFQRKPDAKQADDFNSPRRLPWLNGPRKNRVCEAAAKMVRGTARDKSTHGSLAWSDLFSDK